MPVLTLILGGARSGKSRFALDLGKKTNGEKYFIATAEALDAEMATRIEEHQRERGVSWKTIEAPLQLAGTIQSLEKNADIILIDCLTLWLSNLMMQKDATDASIIEEIAKLVDTVTKVKCLLIAVSNEVGLGIVPANAETRRFRDFAGLLHQKYAAVAQEVYFMVAGISQRIKGTPDVSH